MIKTAPLDVSKYLHDETDIALFLEAAVQEAAEAGDHNIFLAAIAEAGSTQTALQALTPPPELAAHWESRQVTDTSKLTAAGVGAGKIKSKLNRRSEF